MKITLKRLFDPDSPSFKTSVVSEGKYDGRKYILAPRWWFYSICVFTVVQLGFLVAKWIIS